MSRRTILQYGAAIRSYSGVISHLSLLIIMDWLTHIVSTFPITTCRIVSLPVRRVEYERRRPLKDPFLKINFDSTFQGKDRRSYIGIVIRNGRGQVVGSRAIVNCHIPTGMQNKVAHILAKKGLMRGGSTYLGGCVSDFVRDAVENNWSGMQMEEGGLRGSGLWLGGMVQ
ncbi:hypothetical protein Gotri_024215 [Gossypium trilobum]|uniref:RNase H type-1 domain-containing protein n=1 Tax=Gossypium trilobum TaxID=34281 RepID=A0A7J9DLJ5_9ROSI|nr:hypothetical protein [Gossypium trilobum]